MFILPMLFYFMTMNKVSLANNDCSNLPVIRQINGCITFTVSSGTGCAWMCNYCANQLGTNNYYFTDSICTYQQGVGCVGNPVAGKSYTCCPSSS